LCPRCTAGFRCGAEPARTRAAWLTVVDARLGCWRSGLVPVDIGVAELEAELLVEPVGVHPRGARGQIDVAGALLLRQAKGRHRQGSADALAACVLVDDDILDPCSEAGRQREGDEGEHADDGALAAGDEQRVGLVVGDSGKVVSAKWCC